MPPARLRLQRLPAAAEGCLAREIAVREAAGAEAATAGQRATAQRRPRATCARPCRDEHACGCFLITLPPCCCSSTPLRCAKVQAAHCPVARLAYRRRVGRTRSSPVRFRSERTSNAIIIVADAIPWRGATPPRLAALRRHDAQHVGGRDHPHRLALAVHNVHPAERRVGTVRAGGVGRAAGTGCSPQSSRGTALHPPPARAHSRTAWRSTHAQAATHRCLA